MALGIFKTALRLRDWHVFHVTTIGDFERFQYLTLKQAFRKTKSFLKNRCVDL